MTSKSLCAVCLEPLGAGSCKLYDRDLREMRLCGRCAKLERELEGPRPQPNEPEPE